MGVMGTLMWLVALVAIGSCNAVYRGPITLLEDFKKACQECASPTKEIILIITNTPGLEPAGQVISEFRKFNHTHVMIVTNVEGTCAAAARVLPEVCCAWLAYHHPPADKEELKPAFGPYRAFVHIRWRFMARAARLGYNVLNLDTDIVIFDDPYKYLHASPFSNVNLVVTCPEPLPLPVLRKSGVQALYVGKAAKKELPRIPEDGDFAKMVFCLSINAGTFYMRNVAPNGPIAWMMAEVADRQLRWAEGLEEFQKQHPEQTNFHHLFWDQAILTDAMLSTFFGRPVCLDGCQYQGTGTLSEMRNWTFVHAHFDMFNKDRLVTLDYSHPFMNEIIGRYQDSDTMTAMMATVPNAYGQWPSAIGGRLLPPTTSRRSYSLDFIKDLAQATSAPMWLDPEQPIKCAADGTHALPDGAGGVEGVHPGATSTDPSFTACSSEGTPKRYEQIGIAHDLFVNEWWREYVRKRYHWSKEHKPIPTVLGHVLFLANTKAVYKPFIKMVYGHYDWEIAARFKGQGVYFSSTPATPRPQVVALHPSFDLTAMNAAELTGTLLMLAQVSALTRRAILWPVMPCNVSSRYVDVVGKLVKHHPRAHHYHLLASVPPREVPVRQGGHLMCVLASYLWDTCLMNGKGMTMPEFEHYKATGKPDQVNPSDANTIDMSGLAQHPAGAHAGGAGGGGGAGGAGGHGHAHGGHNHSSHGGHHGVKVPAEVNATEHGMHVGLRHWPVAPGRELREHLMMRMRGMDVVYIKDRFRVPDINRMVDENVYKRLSDMLTFCPAMFAAHMYFYQTGPNAGPGPLRRLLGE